MSHWTGEITFQR